MKRIYVECILAVLILFWCLSNIFLTSSLFVACLPAIVSSVIQFIGTLIAATCCVECYSCVGEELCEFGQGHGNGLRKWLDAKAEEENG